MPAFNDRVTAFSVLVILCGVTLVLLTSFVESVPVESLTDSSLREEENEIQTDGLRVAHVREKKSIRDVIEAEKPFSLTKPESRADEKLFPKEVNGRKNANDIFKISNKKSNNNNNNSDITKNIDNNISNGNNSDDKSNSIFERKNKRRSAERIKSDSEQYLQNGEHIDQIIFSEHCDQLPVSRRSPRQSSQFVFVRSDDGSLRFAPNSMRQDDQFATDEYGRGSTTYMNEMPEMMMSPRYDKMADYGYYPANRFSVEDTGSMTVTDGFEPLLTSMNYDPMPKSDFVSTYAMAPDNRGYDSAMSKMADSDYGVRGYVMNYGEYDGARRSEDNYVSNYRTADGGVTGEFMPMDDYSPMARTFNIGQKPSIPEANVPAELKAGKEPPQHPDGYKEPPVVVIQPVPVVIPISKPGCLIPSINPYLHKPLTKPSLPSLLKPDLLDILKPQLPNYPKPELPKPKGLPSISNPSGLSLVDIIKPPPLPGQKPNTPPPPPSSQPPATKPVIYFNKQYVVDQSAVPVPVEDMQQHPPMIHRSLFMTPDGPVQAYTSARPVPYRDQLPFDTRRRFGGDDDYLEKPYLIDPPLRQREQKVIMVRPQSVREILLGMETPKQMLERGNQDLSMNNTLSQEQIMRGALGDNVFDYGLMDPTLGTPPQQGPLDPLRAQLVSRMKKIDREVGDLSMKLRSLELQQRLAHVLAGDPEFLRRSAQRKRENQQNDFIVKDEEEFCCEETAEGNEEKEEDNVKETKKATEETKEKQKETKETPNDNGRQNVKTTLVAQNKKKAKENTKVSDPVKTQPDTRNSAPEQS